MADAVTYSVDEARAILPEIRSTLLALAVERRRANEAGADVMALLDHLRSLGVMVRDLDAGLVDIPTIRDGEPAWLCWRLSDPELAWWHTTSEGFASRRPL
ncbi:MAG TPA: DUF2203 domain-containing protein [Candidatus Limnocylindria bacterium]|nr:DUF2203 domain-containing protein [Candidatus Limnocylindria bacterium]